MHVSECLLLKGRICGVLRIPQQIQPSRAGDYNLHHVCACVGHAVFSETTTVTHFW